MKEVEKNEIKRLSDRLDAIRHQQADLSLVEAADKYAELEKEKATLEAEIARLREVHSQKLSKEAQKLMKMPFQRAITKKEQADMGKLKKKCSRTGGCAPNDRAGPRNGPARDDRVLKDCVLSSFLVAVITASHHLLAPAGTCRSLFQRSNIYNVLNIIYSISSILFSAHARLNSENQVQIKERCININNEFPHINA